MSRPGIACLALSALLLAACGQRGPLFLPEPESPPVETADEEDDDER